MTSDETPAACPTAFDSATFGQDGSFQVEKPVGSATISPCGRDVALASRQGLHIIDLDSPWSPPRHLAYHTPWEVVDVQWSPFAVRDYWVVSTSNQKALVWNLNMHSKQGCVEHVLHAHTRAITDINFSAHYPDILATCAVDSFVHCWDLRRPARPAMTFCDWFAGATQVKWNRTNPHILASSHDKFLRVWDNRKGTLPLKSIEAHATKIYGIDWNRFNTTKLVTCSLDKTIKFWDYAEDNMEPQEILPTAFPVWRARHTPFGYGLLAMPQRGDHDLHLYDCRKVEKFSRSVQAKSVHTFEGHHGQVKEFLWRPRGNVSATMDARDYQLVSWGTDKVLRLHQVTNKVLESVGYRKGMEVKRTTGFTRKGAAYKTFRDTPETHDTDLFFTAHGDFSSEIAPSMRLPSAIDLARSSAPFIGGRKDRDPRTSSGGTKGKYSQELDPISWMRGVKIGKRSTSQSALPRSPPGVMSPTLKAQPTWDVYESLGEEITAIGDRFSKIRFEEVDMQRHRLVVFLPGPWGSDRISTYVRVRVEFPAGYPNTAAPIISIEKMASVQDEVLRQLMSDVNNVASEFRNIGRSSLETILRLFLGEQSISEILQSLRKYHDTMNLISIQDDELSSSDNDDEILGTYAPPQSESIESINPLAMVNNAQYNVPLPKACGALWAANGTLVCFFPAKPEKEASTLDQGLKISPRNRSAISEGFGKLHEFSERRRGPPSMSVTIEDDDSEGYGFETSSSDSSLSSSGIGLHHHQFMPAMAWRGSGLEVFPKLALDGSQKSIGEIGTANSTTHKTSMFISIHELSDLLPSKQSLAQDYEFGNNYQQAAHNALVAKYNGFSDIAHVWSLIELILQNTVPVDVLDHPSREGSIIAIVRRALLSSRDQNSEIDLSFDAGHDMEAPSLLNEVNWGSHPFGQTWLVKALFRHFEERADLQMLAMMSCVFSKSMDMSAHQYQSSSNPILPTKSSNSIWPYYSSVDVARSLSGVSLQSSPRKFLSSTHSAASSTEASTSDHLAISHESNTPPGLRMLGIENARRDSQTTSLSASPEQHRHAHRSNSNLSAFAASFARPFSFTNSAASSPPTSLLQTRASPSGSYVGTTSSSVTWASTGMFSKAPTISSDPKSNMSCSLSDNDDEYPPLPVDTSTKIRGFVTTFKNQNHFHDEGHAHLSVLDANQNWRFNAYREAYGELLSAWNLPFARCELLKYNDGSSSTNASRLSQNMPSIGGAGAESVSLELSVRCKTCGCFWSAHSSGGQCPNCLRASGPPSCILCNAYIHGIASPCLNCGHVLHRSCRRTVLEAGLQECVSGCGCLCADHPFIEMPQPEVRTQSDRYGRDVSPAITVIADPGVNEQDMAGWRGSEWEEMAYESLARNLRGERRGSGRVIRKRASSIWRGRSD